MISYLDRALELSDQITGLRREFHKHPELGFHELETSSRIVSELDLLDIPYEKGIAGTGVIGRIRGKSDSPVGMIRVDMDALPIQEKTGLNFASVNNGVMHACGHDGHMSMGILAARLLKENAASLDGSVLSLFQPAEEGDGGAKRMIEEGALAHPKPDFILGIHLWNEKPVGWISIKDGPLMAGADSLEIVIKGKGGHGGLPQQVVDPVVCAAQIVTSLQTITSRNLSPFDRAVLSLTAIQGGTAFNVIPDQVSIKGTLRTFDAQVRDLVLKRMGEIIHGTCAAYGCEGNLLDVEVTRPVDNDPIVTERIRSVIEKQFPALRIDSEYQTTVSEDFSYYQESIPGCFIFLGSANVETGKVFSHHHPQFDFDETVLPVGAAVLAQCTADLLTQFKYSQN
ncbi:MAG: M20 family metallopeptidase [Anaerolineaceae bacterium]